MSISLNESVDQVRRSFRDVKWQDATLQEWVKDAVRDYAIHFPLLEELSGAATTGTYEYSFGAICLGVVEVEYPTGEDPPEYPDLRNHTEPNFHDGGDYYDVVRYPGQGDAELWLSQPETGESYNVKYYTEYAWTASGSDYTCEVPDLHRPAIVQYVTWCCWREMMTIEKEKGEIESRYNVLAERVLRERQYYDQMIEIYQAARPHESKVVTWAMDEFDPIY
jgi:hypothetical protein